MAVLPMDLQVNMMQASVVADEQAAERQKKRQVGDRKLARWIQERQQEENTSEGADDTNQNPVGTEETSENNIVGVEPETESESSEPEDEISQGRVREPGKGSQLDEFS